MTLDAAVVARRDRRVHDLAIATDRRRHLVAAAARERDRSADGGTIDPHLKTLSLWDGDTPLLALSAYATHPMSYYGRGGVSADFVGYARDAVERALGVPCLFVNGGCADVNPLTATVRRQLAERKPFRTMAREGRHYGAGPDTVRIEDRGGGTFEEAELIGSALADGSSLGAGDSSLGSAVGTGTGSVDGSGLTVGVGSGLGVGCFAVAGVTTLTARSSTDSDVRSDRRMSSPVRWGLRRSRGPPGVRWARRG